MKIINPPIGLFDAATKLSNCGFTIESISMLDSAEYQLLVNFTEEPELYVSVHFKTTIGQSPDISYWFGEQYSGSFTEVLSWSSSESLAEQFQQWNLAISS